MKCNSISHLNISISHHKVRENPLFADIIDDGLLIKGNEVIAGESAKKAPTKIETVND